jgi:NAD(P)-dependent dehydrogenase (short-subunit alcohol dehydrogenase family)
MVHFRIATYLFASVSTTTLAFAPSSRTAFVRPFLATSAVHNQFTLSMSDSDRYSMPDQQARFARAKKESNERYLDITTVYDPAFLKGKRVAVTGANRGIGLALAKELTEAGAKLVAIVRSTSDELEKLNPDELIKGVDQTSNELCVDLEHAIKGGPIDILINNAGYFMREEETLDNLDFNEQLKTIDICAIGPLRVTSALLRAGALLDGSKVVMITSQGGSVTWRTTQNPDGHDYGHHMSKAAANMMAALLAQEVKSKGIAVGIFHPGFNKTGMTEKYKQIWEVEGAVDAAVGAKRIMHEAGKLSMETSGKFINCEDGLEIPF